MPFVTLRKHHEWLKACLFVFVSQLMRNPPAENFPATAVWWWKHVDIVLNVMAHGDAREGKFRGNRRMEWVGSALPLYLGTQSIQHYYLLPADPHSSTASTRLNWLPRRFKWTRPFPWKTKSGFCACAITFKTEYTNWSHDCQLNSGILSAEVK
jgi:hypothetical protein